MGSRSLTQREREVLTFLLGVDFPGVGALRKQAESATVIGRCRCGCATIDLTVDGSVPAATEIARSDVVSAYSREPSDWSPAPELILFVNDGRLSSVEIVWYGDAPIDTFPAPETFEQPIASWRRDGPGSEVATAGRKAGS